MNIHINEGPSQERIIYIMQRKRYGFMSFLFDVFMTCVTFGFWLIWIFIREMRKR